MRKLFLSFCMLPTVLFAQIQVVKQSNGSKASFPLVTKNNLSSVYVDPDDFEVVKKSAGLFASDVERVTGRTPKIVSSEIDLKDYVIIIGTIGKSEILNKLVASKKLRLESLQDQWERFLQNH